MRLLGAPGYEMRERPSVANLRKVAISEATRGRVGPGSRLCVTAEHDAAGPGRLRQRARLLVTTKIGSLCRPCDALPQ